MSTPQITRRGFLLGAGALGAGGVLAGCVGTSGGGGSTASATSTTLTLQSSLSDPDPRAALEAVVAAFDGPETTLNTVAIEQFRAQLSTYLTSNNPPDVLTWYAGSVARDYASQGLLLDVSDLWSGDGACANFSDALKSLSSAEDGKQIFVPTNYYWWSIFYKKSAFQEWGVAPPTTWDEFLALCSELKGKGVSPLANGIGSTPWMASGWFDYLDLRINGAQFHRDLLAGKHKFTDPEVVAVLEEYTKLIPYFDPNMASYSYQEAVTPMVQNKSAMYLIGAFVNQFFPEDQQDDLDFFSVPTIDASVRARRRRRPTATSRARRPRTSTAPRNCSRTSPRHRRSSSSSRSPVPRTCRRPPTSTPPRSHPWSRRASSSSPTPRRSPSSSTGTPAMRCRRRRTTR